MGNLIHLPPELRLKTINDVQEIKPGNWIWVFGCGGYKLKQSNKPKLREVALVGKRWVENYKCSITDENFFVCSQLDKSGLIDTMESYNFADWNIGRHTSNWYVSRNREDAQKVFEYLEFVSRLLDQ